MKVSFSPQAKKEAEKLGAAAAFQQAVGMLRDYAWEYLLKTEHVKALKGQDLKGAYEVKPGGYRGIFAIIEQDRAFIFAFFKKEGGILKRTELEAIKKRLKQV